MTSDDFPTFGRPTIATATSGSGALGGRLARRQAGDDLVEQLVDAVAVLGRDLERRLEAHPVELHGAAPAAAVVGLVDGEHDGPSKHVKALGNLLVARHQPLPRVQDEDDDVGVVQGLEPVLDDELVERVGGGAKQAAGVDQRERAVLPRRRRRQDVPRGARDGRHDGPARAGDAVEERGLADVGPADQHNCRPSFACGHENESIPNPGLHPRPGRDHLDRHLTP